MSQVKYVEVSEPRETHEVVKNYLKENTNPEDRPFECSDLAVIQEDVSFGSAGRTISTQYDGFKQGDLICTAGGSYRPCRIIGQNLNPLSFDGGKGNDFLRLECRHGKGIDILFNVIDLKSK